MSRTKSRFALAAVLAALSAPALADDAPACAVCGDPTWPALENPAPAVTAQARGGEAEALAAADPTWPETTSAMPAIALAPYRSDGQGAEPVVPSAPTVDYAVVLGAPVQRVAAK